MIDSARAHDRLLLEALWTRFLPAWRAAEAHVAAGVVGDVRELALDRDPVLGALELHLEVSERLRGLELRVALHHDHEPCHQDSRPAQRSP